MTDDATSLRHFEPAEILIARHDAWTILRFFWPTFSVTEAQLTDKDLSFAQAVLLEAVDKSYAMGFVEKLFTSAYGKVPGSFKDVRDIVKSFAKAAAKHWFKHAINKDPMKAEIYESVKVTIARLWRSTVQEREISGDYTGY